MTPQEVLRQYLEGAITFAEFVSWFGAYHVQNETVAAECPKPFCATCGQDFPIGADVKAFRGI